jgi:hypothetical protein
VSGCKKSAEGVIAKKCTNCKTGSVRVAMPVRKQLQLDLTTYDCKLVCVSGCKKSAECVIAKSVQIAKLGV